MKNKLNMSAYLVTIISVIPFSLIGMKKTALQEHLVAQLKARVITAQQLLDGEQPDRPFCEILVKCNPVRFKLSEIRKKVVNNSTPTPLRVTLDSVKTELIYNKPELGTPDTLAKQTKDTEKAIDELLASLDEPWLVKKTGTEIDDMSVSTIVQMPTINITQKIYHLHNILLRVSKSAQDFDLPTPATNPDFTFDLEELDKMSDALAPFLDKQITNDALPALNRLKDFANSEQAIASLQKNETIKRKTEFRAYTASLNSLQRTLAGTK